MPHLGFYKTRVFILTALLAVAIVPRIRYGQFFSHDTASFDWLMLSGLACGSAFLLRSIPARQKAEIDKALWRLRWIVPTLGVAFAAIATLLQMTRARPAYLVDLAAAGFNIYSMPIPELVRKWLLAHRQRAGSLGTPGPWQTFTSLAGRYSVEMPGIPAEATQTESDGGLYHVVQLALPDGAVFNVTWFDVPELEEGNDALIEYYLREMMGEPGDGEGHNSQ